MFVIPRSKVFTTLLFSSLVSGCAAMNPMAMARLAAFDPLSADASQIAVAVRLPEALMLRNGDLVMRIKISSQDRTTSFDQSFLLEIVDAEGSSVGGLRAQAGERPQIAKVAENDLARLREVQVKAQARKAIAKGKGEGSLTVGIQGGCKTEELKAGPLNSSIYLKTNAANDYYPLISNMDMRKQFGTEVMAKVPACGAG